ncbi:hypothetical protein KR009_008432, partial [Drosophila setifemur]
SSNRGLYLATFYSNIGTFLFGIALGWTGPAENPIMEKGAYGFTPTHGEWDTVCALLPLGAASSCVPMGLLMRSHGCKLTLLAQLLPNCLGWGLTVFAQSLPMLCVGRFVLGVSGGAHCVAVPVYSAAISPKDRRGSMGVVFHGTLMFGVFYSGLIARVLDLRYVNSINLLLQPLGLLTLLLPESPIFYVDRENLSRAQASLRWLRGKEYDQGMEMDYLMREPTESEINLRRNPMLGCSQKKPRRSLARILALAVFQKMCGAVIFIIYGMNMMLCLRFRPEWVTSLGVAGIVGFLFCFFLVDRLGRRFLLIFTVTVILLMGILLSLYFHLLLQKEVPALQWTALVLVFVFVVAYTAGLGPLVWLLNVELTVRPMQHFSCALAATLNWLIAFALVVWYSSHPVKCHGYLFLLFSVIMVMVLLFALIFLPETMNCSSEKIQKRLGGIMN